MDLSKLVWLIVIVAVVGGGWLLTTGGMEKVYTNATDDLIGNDPEQDIKDEAILSKYGGFQQTLFRFDNAKRFYTAAIEHGPEAENYWANLHQLGRCEEELGNEATAIDIYYDLWQEDASQYDNRVPARDALKSKIERLIGLNDMNIYNYPMRD